jgi:hypothetical protein
MDEKVCLLGCNVVSLSWEIQRAPRTAVPSGSSKYLFDIIYNEVEHPMTVRNVRDYSTNDTASYSSKTSAFNLSFFCESSLLQFRTTDNYQTEPCCFRVANI